MAGPDDGIILVDKEEGEMSFGVVKRVKGILRARKTGHAGTLDPFATGLLIVLVGEGTKLAPFLMDADKEYEARIRLGVETDTLDLTGRVVRTSPVPDLDPGLIRDKARGLTGDIEQVPPMFSAVKVKGQRAYALARKGINVALAGKKVRVQAMEIVSVELPDLCIRVVCSKGTYVRSLAAELGKELGTGAHTRTLRRLSIGFFHVRDALELGRIEPADRERIVRGRILALPESLPHLEEIQVDGRIARNLRNGIQPLWDDLGGPPPVQPDERGYVKVMKERELIAVLQVCRELGPRPEGPKIVRVFH